MYQYVKKNLEENIESKKRVLEEKSEEQKKVEEKLEVINYYDNLRNAQFLSNFLTIISMLFGIAVGCLAVAFPTVASIFLSVASVFSISYAMLGLKYIIDYTKKIKILKAKGVKQFKKQTDLLQEKKLVLEKEVSDIKLAVDEIAETLAHIDFYEKTAADFLYQADSREEYESMLDSKLKCEQLLDEYLDETANSRSIDLNDHSNDPVVLQKKLWCGKRS